MQFKPFIIPILLIFLLSIGCATTKGKLQFIKEKFFKADSKTPIESITGIKEIRELSFQQVKEDIISEWLKFTSLKANVDLTIKGPEFEGSFKCKGVMRLQKPDKMRIIGSKLASTVFDMLSDGEYFWFYLPNQKMVYTGKCNAAHKTNDNIYIYPDDIAVLLNYDKLFEGRSAFMETWPTLWLVHVFNEKDNVFTPYSRLKIDRVENKVNEITLFQADSIVKAQAFFDEYTLSNGQIIPQTVQINWPETDTNLTLNLKDISINETLNPQIFQFKKPKNTDIIKID